MTEIKKIGRVNNRNGHKTEKLYRNLFREFGFQSCEVSKVASQKHDNAKIDLMFLPFNIQIKAGNHKNLSAGKELLLMQSCIADMFPKGDEVFSKPLLLIHHKYASLGQERVPEDALVYMSLIQFDIFKKESPTLEYVNMKTFRFDTQSEFKTIVSITFDDFRDKIILKNYVKEWH